MSRNLTIYFDLFLIMTLENYFNNCVRSTRRSFSFFFVYSRRVADTTDGLIYNTYHVCVVFTSNRSFYPTSAHPVSVLILHPRDTNYVVRLPTMYQVTDTGQVYTADIILLLVS